ncbi:TetR/AcrR family transcriptional regulator [Pedobacter sp. ISL-68]|uniref:TetR/AcrR family transcriptional regulator n=1 Tax=unclassified Pedobacter TaxID=2628915 RepID=UPI001BE7C7CF|nr:MULTISPECIES: TetR/AcrR family transcriptional regulator [unclassified Pedobacter]MBT2559798.1 TetR/AcrR family transcriptional regulator [Pedobacter sp. ISL-64]MBT2592103.1 TetR/AcrR family transcriptional regulator [Pedobacter sp. ISL-68]
MTRKITSGPIRDKERTKNKLLNAVGAILKKDGFTGLNVSRIAAKANLNRKLIYEYFGSMEGLVKEYLNSRDYYTVNIEQTEEFVEKSRSDHGKEMLCDLLENQLNTLVVNEELRSIISWGISESSTSLKELNEKREFLGEQFFAGITDEYFKNKDKNIRPVTALLIGGIYYMALIAHTNDGLLCGIDIRKIEAQEEIKKTLRQIIDWAYL